MYFIIMKFKLKTCLRCLSLQFLSVKIPDENIFIVNFIHLQLALSIMSIIELAECNCFTVISLFLNYIICLTYLNERH